MIRMIILVVGIAAVLSGGVCFADDPIVDVIEEVESLEAFQVPATVIHESAGEVVFLRPSLSGIGPLPSMGVVPAEKDDVVKLHRGRQDLLRDHKATQAAQYQPSRLENGPPPAYPRDARRQGWEGAVVVRLQVGVRGDVKATTVQKSSGHALLDEAAIRGVQPWRFHPAKDGEIPIPSTVDVPIQFSLTNHP